MEGSTEERPVGIGQKRVTVPPWSWARTETASAERRVMIIILILSRLEVFARWREDRMYTQDDAEWEDGRSTRIRQSTVVSSLVRDVVEKL
jgi:hypothetical protein